MKNNTYAIFDHMGHIAAQSLLSPREEHTDVNALIFPEHMTQYDMSAFSQFIHEM